MTDQTAATADLMDMPLPLPLTDEQIDAAAKVLVNETGFPMDWDHMPSQGRNDMRAAVRRILAAAGIAAPITLTEAPRDWKLVPLKPTPEMLDAAYWNSDQRSRETWAAMLAAAPDLAA